MGNVETRIRWRLELVGGDKAGKQVLAQDRQIRRSVEQTEKAQNAAARAALKAGASQARGARTAATALTREGAAARRGASDQGRLATATTRAGAAAGRAAAGRRREGTAVRGTASDLRAYNAAQAQALSLGNRIVATTTKETAAIQARGRAARTAAASERARARGIGAGGAAAGVAAAGGRGIRNVAATAGGGLLAFQGIRAFVGFEKQMDRVEAVTGATRAQIRGLTDEAKQLGADTQFSAGQAAEGMYELATAGFTANQTLRIIPGTLDLAAASGVELADAAELQASALRGFQLEAGQAGHVADVLAQAVNSSAIEMADLAEFLPYVASTAKQTGTSFEEVVAAAGLLGNVGIKGSMAGTAIRTSLLRLTDPSAKMQRNFKAMGIEAEDLAAIPLPEAIGRISEGLDRLPTRGAKVGAISAIFGKEAAPAMLNLMAKGRTELERLSAELLHSEGAAKKSADTMRNNVSGSWDQFTGSLETAAITIGEDAGPALQRGLNAAAGDVNDFAAALTGAKADGWAADAGRGLRSAGRDAGYFVRSLEPLESFAGNVLVPLGHGLGTTLLVGMKGAAGAASLLARGLGEVGNALEGHGTLLRIAGVALALWASRSGLAARGLDKMGRAGGAIRLLLAPLRLVGGLSAAIFSGKAVAGATGLLGRYRNAWLGVAAAEKVAATSGVAATATGTAAATRGGGRLGALGNAAATYGVMRSYGGSGRAGAMGGVGRFAALRGAAPIALAGLGPAAAAAIGVSLVAGVISGVTSKRSDFSGKWRDFLHGATFGVMDGAGKSLEDQARKAYGDALNRGFNGAAQFAKRGEGMRAVRQLFDTQRDVLVRPGATFRRPDVDRLSIRQMGQELARLQRERGRLQALTAAQPAARYAGRGGQGAAARANAGAGELRNTEERIKALEKALDPVLQKVPGLARAFEQRGDYTALTAMRRELELAAQSGGRAADAFLAVTRAQRGARGARFQAATRNLERGAATNLGEIRSTVAQANADLKRRGVTAGTADYARAQERLAAGAVANVKKLVRQNVISVQQGEREIKRILTRAQTSAGQNLAVAARAGVRGLDQTVRAWAKGWGKAGKITDVQVDAIGNRLAKLPGKARQQSAQAMVLMARTLESRGKLPRGSADRLVFLLQSRFEDLGNIDEPVKDPLRRTAQLLDGLKGPADRAFTAMQTLTDGFSHLVPPALIGQLQEVARNIDSIPPLQPLEELAAPKPKRKRRGGAIDGTLIRAAGGELYIDPSSGLAGIIPGDPRSDSTLMVARPGAAIVTADGQERLLRGDPLDQVLARQAPHFRGGGVVNGMYTSTSYGPPWGGINGGGVTKTGVNLRRSPHLYGVAVDPRMIKLGSSVYTWPNPFGYSGTFSAFDTGGAIKDKRIDFYDWRGRKQQMGWGRRRTRVSTSRLTRRPGESGYQASSPTGRGAEPKVRVLGSSRTRAGLVEDAFSQGIESGQGGLTRGWIGDRGNPFIRVLREAIERNVERGETASRYRKPKESSSAGGSGWAAKRQGQMMTSGKRFASRGLKYAYGGGHGGWNYNLRGYDCSGLVSHILHSAGYLSSPMTTDGFKSFGRSGPGQRVTVGVRGSSGRSAHMMMKVGSAFFEAGSRGVGRFGSWNGTFPIKRHPPGMRRGGVVRGPRGRLIPVERLDPRHSEFVGWGFRRGGRVPRFQTGGPVGTGGSAQALVRGPRTDGTFTAEGAGGALVRGVRTALTLRAGTLERLDRAIGQTTVARIESLRTAILRAVHRGGPERVVQRYQEMLSLLDFELGRRAGELLEGVAARGRAGERFATGLDRSQRVRGIRPESHAAIVEQGELERAVGEGLRQNIADLEAALRIASRRKDRDAMREIRTQLEDAQDALAESFTRQVELARDAFRAWAQGGVDTAQFGLDQVQGGLSLLEAGQRLRGVAGAAALGQLPAVAAGADFLSQLASARADSPEAMRERATAIAGTLLPALQEQRGALQNQLAVAQWAGDEELVRGATTSLQSNAFEIASALGDAAELLRDAALTAADQLVAGATHGTSLAQLGQERLELEQRLGGSFDGGGGTRAQRLKDVVIPALEAELKALRDKRGEEERQGAPLDQLRQTIEAEAAKSNEILRTQVDALEAIESNTADKPTGPLGFESRGQPYTDVTTAGV